MIIELSKNEYTIAKFLSEATEPKTSGDISFELGHDMTNLSKWYPTRWYKKDTTAPTGYWRSQDVELIAEKLSTLGLIAFIEKSVGGISECCPHCKKEFYVHRNPPEKYYYMTDAQKEQFKTVQVKPVEIRVPRPRGRPRKYKSNAERQRAYRERKKGVTK